MGLNSIPPPPRHQAGPKPSLIGTKWNASRSLILTCFFGLEFSDSVIVRHCSGLARAVTGSPTPAHCQPSTFTEGDGCPRPQTHALAGWGPTRTREALSRGESPWT